MIYQITFKTDLKEILTIFTKIESCVHFFPATIFEFNVYVTNFNEDVPLRQFKRIKNLYR